MTDSLLRRARSKVALTPLALGEVDEARELCSRDPVAYVMPAMHLEHAAAAGRMVSGQLWGIRDGGQSGRGRGRDRSSALVGVLWVGTNLVPALPDASDGRIDAVADAMLSRLARPGALVGEAAVVLRLWERVEKRWGRALFAPSSCSWSCGAPPCGPSRPGQGTQGWTR